MSQGALLTWLKTLWSRVCTFKGNVWISHVKSRFLQQALNWFCTVVNTNHISVSPPKAAFVCGGCSAESAKWSIRCAHLKHLWKHSLLHTAPGGLAPLLLSWSSAIWRIALIMTRSIIPVPNGFQSSILDKEPFYTLGSWSHKPGLYYLPPGYVGLLYILYYSLWQKKGLSNIPLAFVLKFTYVVHETHSKQSLI